MRAEEKAKKIITDGLASCVVVKNGAIARTETGPGVSPLVSIYESEPEILRDARVFDKVVGKAAAMIVVLGGAESAYGEIMGASARAYLAEHGCSAAWGELVDFIRNRRGDGLCPLELAVSRTEDARTGYLLLKKAMERLKAEPAGRRKTE